MLGLGRVYDIGSAFVGDLAAGGATGLRQCMKNFGGIDVVMIMGAGTAGDEPVPSLQQHTAETGGVSAALPVITDIYRKSETTLDNDESWARTQQAAAAIMTAVPLEAAKQNIYVIHVSAQSLTEGYGWISVNQADMTAAKVAAIIYLGVDPKVQRTPANMPSMLKPGTANV